ncbi:helix-turn-helix domain-containing protein [Kitasatospora aburaviensis]|uniref:AraC-like ligand-binding domain-containing protein n=1 Tax=Kitasatospora aburaviensis TaxID=67265 RepID=UPI0031EE7651
MPPADRFEWFRAAVSSDLMPVALSSEHTSDFRAEITNLELGTVRLSTFAFSPVVSRRTPAHVRRGDPEQYQLAWITSGAFHVAQLGREALVTGDLMLTDTSRPMENTALAEIGQARAAVLQIPRSVLPLRSDRVDGLLARRLPAHTGTGAILTGFLETLLRHGPGCRPEELARMGAVALDLAGACLAQQLGTPDEVPAEARAQAMMQRITTYIEHNLGDPELTPQTIADRHGISLRTLYGLFRDRPDSVAATIRRARLERCRAELECPHLGGLPVQTIATRWGFASSTAFSRAFRDAYGLSPTEHRANARHDAGLRDGPEGFHRRANTRVSSGPGAATVPRQRDGGVGATPPGGDGP